MRYLSYVLVLTVSFMFFILAGCGDAGAAAGQEAGNGYYGHNERSPLQVVATVFPQYDFIRQIAGDRVDLTMLISPGAEPHSFEPTPRDMITLNNADLLVYIGGHSEHWVYPILESLERTDMRTLALMNAVDVLLEIHDFHHHHDHDHHDHGDGEHHDYDGHHHNHDRHYGHEHGHGHGHGHGHENDHAHYITGTCDACEDDYNGHLHGHDHHDHDHDHDHDHHHHDHDHNDNNDDHSHHDHHHEHDHNGQDHDHQGHHHGHDHNDHDHQDHHHGHDYDHQGHHHGHDHDHDHVHHHHHDHPDEHVWTSPLNAAVIVAVLAEILSEMDPSNADYFRANAASYIDELNALDQAFTDVVAQSQRNTVVFGDRFPFLYLFDAYNLTHYAAFVGCGSETQASPATVANLINIVQEQDIPVVFYIEFSDQAIANVIAESTGARLLEMHSANNVSHNDFIAGITYLDIMYRNLEMLREALN